MSTEQVSSKTLWQATLASIVVGLVMLVTLIMPAEYNIDPTGVGKALGLTTLSPEALAKAKEAAQTSATSDTQNSAGEVVEITVLPNSGVEYKMTMQSGGQLDFEWMTNGSEVYVDMHGEPKGDTSGYFKSYAIATVNEMKGSFIAPFEGTHGWYFKNDTDTPVVIQLFFNGQFENPHML